MTAVLEKPDAPTSIPRRSSSRTGWFLVAPAMSLTALFIVIPGALALVGSLFAIDITSGVEWTWVGLDNYTALFADSAVRQSLLNTVLYCAMTIVPSLVIGFWLAVLAHSLTRGRRLVQTLLFLPFTANLVAMAVVFRWIFSLNGGFANEMLALIGVAPLNFLGESTYALPTVAAVGVWRGAALAMILFLSGLTSIPTSVDEACAADGITGLTRLRRVVLPLLKPITIFVTVMIVLQSVQVFDTINVMTGGGPLGATETALTMTWRLGFAYYDLGQAAALSTILLLVLIAIGVLRRRSLSGGNQ
ncbi:sugar ABC transporter permease [Rhodococcus sp. SBT000017]|uniref:carbohydrate ABC transporter permease n=1 Tax=Rhodococcus sp. SBT000017 TaxID=1803385 RepID=UPI000EF89E69|nr:sugar ABC transporter permease [Rhodococcus sp. SBT000017]RMB71840.1 sugar ABC transporter permease [Rhodococcus sp. SBT000017]